MKYGCFEGYIISGMRAPIFFAFVLDMPPGYRMICEEETKQI